VSPMQQAGSLQSGLRRRESPFAFHFQQQKLQCRAEGRLAADECDEEEGAGAALVAAEHEVGVQRHVVAGTDATTPATARPGFHIVVAVGIVYIYFPFFFFIVSRKMPPALRWPSVGSRRH
jgi:hypothetical protein